MLIRLPRACVVALGVSCGDTRWPHSPRPNRREGASLEIRIVLKAYEVENAQRFWPSLLEKGGCSAFGRVRRWPPDLASGRWVAYFCVSCAFGHGRRCMLS